jgi:hypothetical protein
MLSKCANPGCSAIFRYFHVGTLFRSEMESATPKQLEFGTDPSEKKGSRRVEFFWLCPDCSSQLTLAFQQSGGVVVTPLRRAKSAAG